MHSEIYPSVKCEKTVRVNTMGQRLPIPSYNSLPVNGRTQSNSQKYNLHRFSRPNLLFEYFFQLRQPKHFGHYVTPLLAF